MARVSVVMATFERPAMLAEAVQSVVRQAFSDWELLVVDDGSTDGTPELLGRLAREEPRLRPLRIPHSARHGRVRNEAIRASRASLVAFLDDDDQWHAHALGHLVELMEPPGTVLAFGRMERFGAGHGVWPRDAPPAVVDVRRLLRGNPVPLSAAIARRDALLAAGLFPEDVEATPDYELWLRLARLGTVRGSAEVVARYRVHPGNMSRRLELECEELDHMYSRLQSEWALPRHWLAPGRRAIARSRARRATSWTVAARAWVRALHPWP
jgi:glycosyltransferase involved in cell wall biosynthesis